MNERRKLRSIPDSLELDGVFASSRDRCGLFSKFFERSFNPVSRSFTGASVSSSVDFTGLEQRLNDLPLLDINDIDRLIKGLDRNKGAGPDGFPPSFFKDASKAIAVPLLLIFNASIRERSFPSIWKMAHVTPIFKSGSRSSVDNFRGISILSCPAKMIELHITKFLTDQLRHILSRNQHAYLSGRSTTTNLVEYVSRLQNNLEQGVQVDAIYTDFSKAFDVIPHDLLLAKLSNFGIGSRITDWLSSYLSGRQQRVKIENTLSNPVNIPSGVPQGSHIGPLLFAIYINDLLLSIERLGVGCSAYADDLKIFIPVYNDSSAQKLQDAIEIVKIWCEANGMLLNPTKCQTISFTRKQQPLEFGYTVSGSRLKRVYSIKDLGVFLDNKLTFGTQIDRLVSRARSTLGMVKRFSGEFQDQLVTLTLYKSLVRPILEYASPVWAPNYASASERVESVQKQFVLYALRHHYPAGTFPLPPYTQRLDEINLDSLINRRKASQILLAYDGYAGTFDCEWICSQFTRHIPSRLLRYNEFFRVEHRRTNYSRYEPINHAKLLFNSHAHLLHGYRTKKSFKEAVLVELRAA